tara:strand:+ start:3711 stop:4064 length:354 start_codon:yes stop_codon:yes gene_type:complete
MTFEYPGPPQIEPNPTNEGVVRWARQMVAWAYRVMNGKTANIGSVTLTASAASTVVTDTKCTTGSVIVFDSETANAMAEYIAGGMYVATAGRVNGSFTITHANNAQTDRTFRYIITG